MKLAVRILILALVLSSQKLMADEMRAFQNLDARLQAMNNYGVTYVDGKKSEVIKSASGRQTEKQTGMEVKLITKKKSEG